LTPRLRVDAPVFKEVDVVDDTTYSNVEIVQNSNKTKLSSAL